MPRDTQQAINPVYGTDEQPAVQTAPDDKADNTAIAQGVTISGDLHGKGDVLVEGTVVGGIDVGGAVTVSGTVKGPIHADAVYVSGCVVGDITARTCLRLKMSGSITGDVTVRSFTIEDGGYFNGQSHMTCAGEEPVILY